MRYASLRRVAPAVSLLGCGATALVCTDEDRRRLAVEKLLSLRRALHAAACVGNMAVRYKTLSWWHSAQPADTYRELLSKTHEDCAQLGTADVPEQWWAVCENRSARCYTGAGCAIRICAAFSTITRPRSRRRLGGGEDGNLLRARLTADRFA